VDSDMVIEPMVVALFGEMGLFYNLEVGRNR
jgi:hypothetical protein